MSKVFTPSKTLTEFLEVELRNEHNGGDHPTTLISALSSLMQMDQEVLRGLNEEMKDADWQSLHDEIRGHIADQGGKFEIEDAEYRNSDGKIDYFTVPR